VFECSAVAVWRNRDTLPLWENGCAISAGPTGDTGATAGAAMRPVGGGMLD